MLHVNSSIFSAGPDIEIYKAMILYCSTFLVPVYNRVLVCMCTKTSNEFLSRNNNMLEPQWLTKPLCGFEKHTVLHHRDIHTYTYFHTPTTLRQWLSGIHITVFSRVRTDVNLTQPCGAAPRGASQHQMKKAYTQQSQSGAPQLLTANHCHQTLMSSLCNVDQIRNVYQIITPYYSDWP